MYQCSGIVLNPLAQTWSNPEQASQRSLQSYCDTPAAAIQMMNMKASRASWPQMNHGITLRPGLGPVERRRTRTTIKDKTDYGSVRIWFREMARLQTYSSDIVGKLGGYAATDVRKVRGLRHLLESALLRESWCL